MAGINVPQYEIFKIGSKKLEYNNWNLNITNREAFLSEELVSLFQAQEFRLIPFILNKKIEDIDFSEYICSVVIENMSHFNKITSKKGIKINGKTFRRFVGTTGGLKNNTLLMVSTDIYDELNRHCECNRNPNIPLVPAKYEAYKALSCSASQQIISPNGILVVKDCITTIYDDIIYLDNSDSSEDSPRREFIKNAKLENIVSDGFNLCTYEYMDKVSKVLGLGYVTSGICLRNAWLKGMLYAFPIIEFIEKYNLNSDGSVNYLIEDVWGNLQDIRECEMILTESSLKLWYCYDSIEDYVKSYKEHGYEFAVTKISPYELDDERELNYQYIQSYDLSYDDIKELAAPTVKKLKNSLCGDYQSTLDFIGSGGDDSIFSWQRALNISPYMMKDSYIIDCVYRMIKKKINNAKIGKLIVNGNYQIASGDPFALMQSICGLKVTGLLKSEECYSSYWNKKNENEVVIFRSPMTSHNNIRKCTLVNNEEVKFWYKYMDNIMIINGFDTFCQAENGCDWDGDILFSTNNSVLKRKHVKLPAIVCAQSNTKKVIINENEIKKTNKNGMGNKVGTITNRVTGFIEVQSHFETNTKEYNELQYRIECGQLYQQDEIDKIKGIISKPMPNSWYSSKSCNTQFLKDIVLDKKPYFMIYVYEDYKRKYNTYINNANLKCIEKYNCTLEELYNKDNRTEEEEKYIEWYEKKMPFGKGECSINKLCFYIESQFKNYKSNLKSSSDFNYNVLKKKRRCTEKHRKELYNLLQTYIMMVKNFKNEKMKIRPFEENVFINDKELEVGSRKMLQKKFYEEAKNICPDDDERLNIVLDICYQYKNNKQFCWDIIGDLICHRLEELEDEKSINY